MKPKEPNPKRHLELVHSSDKAQEDSEAESAHRIVDPGSLNAHELDNTEKEKRAMIIAAKRLWYLSTQINDSYPAQKKRDINAGKLLKAFLFAAQAGLSEEPDFDVFMEDYTAPADEHDQVSINQAIAESARLANSLWTLEEAFTYIIDPASGKSQPESLAGFRQAWENSAIWDNEQRRAQILEALENAYQIIGYKAAQRGIKVEQWLQDCDDVLTQDGMRLVVPDEDSGTEEEWHQFEVRKGELIRNSWQQWQPKLSII